jgi:hypothetical protein
MVPERKDNQKRKIKTIAEIIKWRKQILRGSVYDLYMST